MALRSIVLIHFERIILGYGAQYGRMRDFSALVEQSFSFKRWNERMNNNNNKKQQQY